MLCGTNVLCVLNDESCLFLHFLSRFHASVVDSLSRHKVRISKCVHAQTHGCGSVVQRVVHDISVQ